MHRQFFSLRDVFFKVFPVGSNVSIVDIQVGEAEVSLIRSLVINAVKHAKSAVGAKEDESLFVDDGGVPIELRIGQSVFFGVVIEDTCLRVELRVRSWS